MMRRLRIVLWALVACVALVAVTGLALQRLWPKADAASERWYATAFSLVDQNGATVTEADFLGKPSAWFFGFTNCPDVCPTALSEMAAILSRLGADADKLQVVFVSVDPQRDTPAIMKEYAAYFDPRIVGLTGTPEAIAAMTKARHIFSEKVPLEGGDYAMEHTAGVQLVSSEGAFFGTLDSQESLDVRLGKVRRLIGAE